MNTYEVKRVEDFARMERELNLFDRTYDQVKYWHMLRFACCEGMFNDRLERGDGSEKKDNKIKKICSAMNRALRDIKPLWNYLFPKRCDILMFSISKLHSRFFTSLELPAKYKTLLYRYSKVNGEKEECIYNPAFFLSLKMRSERVHDDSAEKAFFVFLEQTIRERFGRSISADKMEQIVKSYIKRRKPSVAYYKRLFRKTRCKAILITCYYCGDHFFEIEAAKECKIPVIELQHGVVKNHIEYWFDDDTKEYEYVPDYFLLYGEAHKQWIKLPVQEKILMGGYTHQAKRLKEVQSIVTDDKLIVVYPKLSAVFEEEICKMADILTSKGYRIVVKMHPGEAVRYRTLYPLISSDKNVEIITDQSKDVYYWLKKGAHHVMASSTVGLEAMKIDTANVYISLHTEHAQTKPLLDWNVAVGYDTAEELVELITSPDKPDKKQIALSLWSENANDNIVNAIKEIIGE